MNNDATSHLNEILEHLFVLTGYSGQDPKILSTHRETTTAWTEIVVQAFYDTLFSYPPTASVFSEGEREKREQMLRDWYQGLVAGNITEEWWQHQWFVGLVHIKRGVSNIFLIGMMSRIQQLFLGKCLETLPPAEAEELFGAFKRVTDVVTGLIADGYFENYFIALERTVGFKTALIQRMLDMEVNKMLEEWRNASP